MVVRNSIVLLQNARLRRNKLGVLTSRAGTDSIVHFGGDRALRSGGIGARLGPRHPRGGRKSWHTSFPQFMIAGLLSEEVP